jgi:hypothetical protein
MGGLSDEKLQDRVFEAMEYEGVIISENRNESF